MQGLYETPLEIAVAWICSRDHDLIDLVLRDLFVPLEQAVETLNTLHSKQIALMMDTSAAWSLLRDVAVVGAVQLLGYPFEKGPYISAVGTFDAPYGEERDLRPASFPPKKIGNDILPELELAPGRDGLTLKPRKWATEGGTWWKSVEVWNWDDLIREFPDQVQVNPSREQAEPRNIGPKVREVARMIQEEWPNMSWLHVKRKEMLEILRAKFKGSARGLEKDDVSNGTFKRAIGALERGWVK